MGTLIARELALIWNFTKRAISHLRRPWASPVFFLKEISIMYCLHRLAVLRCSRQDHLCYIYGKLWWRSGAVRFFGEKIANENVLVEIRKKALSSLKKKIRRSVKKTNSFLPIDSYSYIVQPETAYGTRKALTKYRFFAFIHGIQYEVIGIIDV